MASRGEEALFLAGSPISRVWTLSRDFVNFTLILVFYAACWSWGGAAYLIDNMFATRLFDGFVRFIEYVDNGGR